MIAAFGRMTDAFARKFKELHNRTFIPLIEDAAFALTEGAVT